LGGNCLGSNTASAGDERTTKKQYKGVLQTMKQTNAKKTLSFILCMVLIAAMALIASGCNANKNDPAHTTEQPKVEATKLGEGQTTFNFTVVDKDGNETKFEIKTDKTLVGEALQELNLIEGEPGAYGLYVKKVNGIVADYDIDKHYWAFYIDGKDAMTGVDSTEIEEGTVYRLERKK
jgi:hypothetical protein